MDKLRTITHFLRVVEARTFVAAAHQVDLTPSALSRAIASLEQLLGFTLFDRSTRHLVLTQEGRAYYDVCRRLLEELEDVELASAGARVTARGRLRIGVHPALRTALLSDLRQFLADHVELSLEMIANNSPAAVLDQGLDVVLSIGELADSGLVARPLGSVEFIVVASPDYLRTHSAPTDPEDLLQHRTIVYGRPDEEPADHWHFSKGKEQRSVEVPVTLMVRDGLGAIDAALLGIGVLRPYSIAVAKPLTEGKLVPLLRDWSSDPQPVHALYSRRKHPSAKVAAFVDYAAKALSKPVAASCAS
jgi:LysR family transcriptional regulator for bpeEF and oprC